MHILGTTLDGFFIILIVVGSIASPLIVIVIKDSIDSNKIIKKSITKGYLTLKIFGMVIK